MELSAISIDEAVENHSIEETQKRDEDDDDQIQQTQEVKICEVEDVVVVCSENIARTAPVPIYIRYMDLCMCATSGCVGVFLIWVLLMVVLTVS